MTQETALYQFFSGFHVPKYEGVQFVPDPEKPLPAYPTNAPDGAMLPYLTYPPKAGYNRSRGSLTVQIWMYTESVTEISCIVQEIAERLGYGGATLHCDGGTIVLYRDDDNFDTSTSGQGDSNMKVRMLNITAQFNIMR